MTHYLERAFKMNACIDQTIIDLSKESVYTSTQEFPCAQGICLITGFYTAEDTLLFEISTLSIDATCHQTIIRQNGLVCNFTHSSTSSDAEHKFHRRLIKDLCP